jgi:hypothetical protein
MRLIGTLVPSFDVAKDRRTSNPDRSSGVIVSSAVRRGSASVSRAIHQARGDTNDSTGYAIASSATRVGESIALTGGSSTGGSGSPSCLNARSADGPPSMSSVQIRPSVTPSSSMVTGASGTTTVAPAAVAPGVIGSRSTRPCGASFFDSRNSSSRPNAARMTLSWTSASIHHSPSSCDRANSCQSPPSPRWARSSAHRPSGEDDRKFSVTRSSTKTPASSRRSSEPPSSWNHTSWKNPMSCSGRSPGAGCRVYQSPAPSPRQAIEPPAVPLLTREIGVSTGSPVAVS